jgi:hypothetical protein
MQRYVAEKLRQSPLTYDFCVALTEAILALVSDADLADLSVDGMDFSHAFEAYLYFACVHDPGVLQLYHAPGEPGAVRSLRGSAARLVAARFAGADIRPRILRRQKLAAAIKSIRTFVAPASKAGAQLPSAAPAAPIVFLARSLRFARYFRPIAEVLGQNAAFLIPDDDAELAAAIDEWSFPYFRYSVCSRKPPENTGRLLRQYASYLLDYAKAMEVALSRSSARLVVVPEGNSAEDEVVHRVARKSGINTACLQQGWSPIVHPGFRNFSYTEMLTWGAGFADLLRPFNPEQSFSLVGNYQLSETLPASDRRDGVLFFFQGFDNWLGGRESADALLALAERVADLDSGAPVYLRPHPVVPFPAEVVARIATKPNMIIEPANRVGLAQALAKARVSVSAYSTTIMESIAAGVVPIIFNTTSMPRYWPDVDAAGAGIETRNIDEAEAHIRRLMGPAGMDRFVAPMAAFSERFFCARGDAARERILARLEALANI